MNKQIITLPHQLIIKLVVLTSINLLISISSYSQGVAINNSGLPPDSSAILDVSSSQQGLLVPRLTTIERDAVINPALSLFIYNTTTNCYEFWAFGDWHELGCATISDACDGVTEVEFEYPSGSGINVTYGTVFGQNNTCWLDRNIGASQVATSVTDTAAYGDLFQWGRGDDGHQVRNPLSGTTTTLSNSDTSGHSNFILTTGNDWRSPKNDNLWQGVSGTNNPCPSGWRVPTEAEWSTERIGWATQNYAGAFASALKLPAAGMRRGNFGDLWGSFYGFYWSSTIYNDLARGLNFSSVANESTAARPNGYSIRCIKD